MITAIIKITLAAVCAAAVYVLAMVKLGAMNHFDPDNHDDFH